MSNLATHVINEKSIDNKTKIAILTTMITTINACDTYGIKQLLEALPEIEATLNQLKGN